MSIWGLLVQNLSDSNSEAAAFWGAVAAQVACRAWGIDCNVTGSTAQPTNLQGIISYICNRYNGSVSEAGMKSVGAAVVTYPGKGATLGENNNTTYPVDIGLLIGGKSGVWNGSSLTTTRNSFGTGLQIGGSGGPWMNADSSQIGKGIDVADYTDYGLHIHGKLSGGTPGVADTSPKKWTHG